MSTGIHTKLLLRGLDFLYTGREAKTKGLAGVCVCVRFGTGWRWCDFHRAAKNKVSCFSKSTIASALKGKPSLKVLTNTNKVK